MKQLRSDLQHFGNGAFGKSRMEAGDYIASLQDCVSEMLIFVKSITETHITLKIGKSEYDKPKKYKIYTDNNGLEYIKIGNGSEPSNIVYLDLFLVYGDKWAFDNDEAEDFAMLRGGSKIIVKLYPSLKCQI
jgi:hypothetical protein